MQPALEAALSELVLGAPLAEDGVDAWLERHQVSGEDAACLRENLPRLLIYRELVRDTVKNAVGLALPRTAARLGPLLDETLARFLAERGPRTHYLRDVTAELLDFALPLWKLDPRVPSYIPDLARHEALELAVAASADVTQGGTDDVELESVLLFAPSLTVARYEHAVHRLPPDEDDRTEPDHAPTALAVYRDAGHELRYLELTPLAASLLEALMAGASLGAAVTRACADASEPVTPAVLAGTSRLLADLSERGCLLGSDPLKAHAGSRKLGHSTAAEEKR